MEWACRSNSPQAQAGFDAASARPGRAQSRRIWRLAGLFRRASGRVEDEAGNLKREFALLPGSTRNERFSRPGNMPLIGVTSNTVPWELLRAAGFHPVLLSPRRDGHAARRPLHGRCFQRAHESDLRLPALARVGTA